MTVYAKMLIHTSNFTELSYMHILDKENKMAQWPGVESSLIDICVMHATS